VTENVEAFEMQCYRKVLRIPYIDQVSNEEVLGRMSTEQLLLGRVRHHKLAYFGHVVTHASLEKDIMIGPMPGLRHQEDKDGNG